MIQFWLVRLQTRSGSASSRVLDYVPPRYERVIQALAGMVGEQAEAIARGKS